MMRCTSTMALALALFASGCAKETATPRQAPPVTVDHPTVRTINEYKIFTGTSRAVESADIVARVAGRLESVEFSPGRRVKTGEVLFTIEPDAYVAARDADAAAVKSAEAELLRARTELQRVERASQNNAVSDMDLDTARANRDKAEAALLSARANLADAELRLGYTRVRSPFDGVVGRNLVDVGNLVGQAGPTLLTTVNKIQPIYIYFHAPEPLVLNYLAWVRSAEARVTADGQDDPDRPRQAMRAFIGLANEDGFPHLARIDFVNNTVDPNTGTIELRARSENEDLFIFPGLFVRVKVEGREIPDAVLVPETAVGSDLGGKFLFVVGQNDIVEQRYVELGQSEEGGLVHIPEGVGAEDTIIVNGLMFARPGLPVRPLTAEQFEQMQRQMAQPGAR